MKPEPFACKKCSGDGIVWIPTGDVNPMSNIHRRHYRSSRGRHGVFYGQNLLCDLGERLEWSFDCYACSGRGIIEWTRGKSLTPA